MSSMSVQPQSVYPIDRLRLASTLARDSVSVECDPFRMASSLSVMYVLSVSLLDGLCRSCFLLFKDLSERVSVGVCVCVVMAPLCLVLVLVLLCL